MSLILGKFQRVMAVGDIHGNLLAFEQVLKKSSYNPKNDLLIFLGDYIDRGKQSCGVVEKVRELVSQGAIALLGNHEKLMIDAITSKDPTLWYLNGGKKTGSSYRRKETMYKFDTKTYYIHYNFLKDLPLYFTVLVGKKLYFFSHAGLNFKIPFDEHTPNDFIWTYHNYVAPKISGDIIFVTGHIRVQELRQRWNQEVTDVPIFLPNKIFLDTGIDFGGKITLCDVVQREYWQAC